jgi:hypothetical protein
LQTQNTTALAEENAKAATSANTVVVTQEQSPTNEDGGAKTPATVQESAPTGTIINM